MGKLSIWVLVDPSTLHHVLRKLNDGENVTSSDLLWRSTHFVELGHHHDLLKHDVEIRWNSSENFLEILGDTFIGKIFIFNDVEHVSHDEADWFDLNWSSFLLLLSRWNSLFNLIIFLDSLQNFELGLAADLHGRKLITVSQNSWDVFHEHLLVDELSEDLPVINIDSSDILLICGYLVHEEGWHNNDDQDEESHQDLNLILLFLQKVWKSNSDCE